MPSILWVILVVVLLMAVFPFPGGWAASWGYGPVSGIGILLIVLIVLLLTGRL